MPRKKAAAATTGDEPVVARSAWQSTCDVPSNARRVRREATSSFWSATAASRLFGVCLHGRRSAGLEFFLGVENHFPEF